MSDIQATARPAEKRLQTGRGTALFITTEFKPDADSGSLRLRYLLQLLRDSHDSVELVLLAADAISDTGRAVIAQLDVRLRLLAGSEADSEPGSAPRSDSAEPAGTANWLSAYAPGERTLVIVSRPQAAGWIAQVRRFLPQARLLYDTVDLHYLRLFRQAKVSGDARVLRHALAHKQVELQACADADATLVVSEGERAVLTAAGIDAVEVVSNVHVPDNDDQHGSLAWRRRRGLLFIGGFLHQPNVDAALYLAREVFPAIRARCPQMDLTIVGGHPPEALCELADAGPSDESGEGSSRGRLRVAGHVADVAPLFASSLACIAPLRYGAGVKGKVSRSLSVGLPVVATPIAAEGMPLQQGENVLIGQDADQLADCVARLASDADLWQRLSDNGLLVAHHYYSLEAAGCGLQQAIRNH